MVARLTLRDLVWRLHLVKAPKARLQMLTIWPICLKLKNVNPVQVLTCIVLMLLWSKNVETLAEAMHFLGAQL